MIKERFVNRLSWKRICIEKCQANYMNTLARRESDCTFSVGLRSWIHNISLTRQSNGARCTETSVSITYISCLMYFQIASYKTRKSKERNKEHQIENFFFHPTILTTKKRAKKFTGLKLVCGWHEMRRNWDVNVLRGYCPCWNMALTKYSKQMGNFYSYVWVLSVGWSIFLDFVI